MQYGLITGTRRITNHPETDPGRKQNRMAA